VASLRLANVDRHHLSLRRSSLKKALTVWPEGAAG
jgi:hypothetical protein